MASQLRALPFGYALALLAAPLVGCGADASQSEKGDRIADSGKGMTACPDCNGDADFAAPETGFACEDGTFVIESYVCDGLADCANGEDEAAALCPLTAEDPPSDAGIGNVYVCRDGLEISGDLRCDLVADCAGGEDEFYCETPTMPEAGDGGFVCADTPSEYGLDIADGWVCDGFIDCPLGDDEVDCPEVECDADAGVSDAGACGDAGLTDAG